MTLGFTVIRDTTPATAIPKGTVVAMGNFDGVHLGHRAVITAALQMGRAHGRPALAVTFEPHPPKFFSPNTPQFPLTDEAAKLRLLAGTGLARALRVTFDKARAGTTAPDFIHPDLIAPPGSCAVRPSTVARRCWKSSCSMWRAPSRERRSTEPSSPSPARN